MNTSQAPKGFSRRIRDLCYLVGAALLVCAVGVAAFAMADIRHVNPLWVFLPLVSLGFLAFAFEAYRNEFRSTRFIFFVSVWMVVNLAVIVFVGSFGWLYLAPALLFEEFLFYMTAYWLFGLEVPSRGGRPIKREVAGEPANSVRDDLREAVKQELAGK